MKKEYNSNIWKMYLFNAMRSMHFFAGVLIPFFTIWGGISFAQVMILQAIFTFSVFLFEVPTGAIADRFGRKTSLILSCVLGVIAALIYASFPNFWIFALGEVLFGIGVTLNSGADEAMIYDSLKENKRQNDSKKVFGRLSSYHIIAMIVAAPIGSLIGKYLGLQWPMLLTSIPFLIGFFIALTLKEPETRMKSVEKDYFKTLTSGFKYFKNHKIIKVLAFDFIALQTVAFFIVWVYQVILQNYSVSVGWFGFVQSALLVCELIVLNSFVGLEKLVGGKKRYLLLCSLIVGISYFVLAFTNNIYIAIVGILTIAGFGLTRKPLFQAYFHKYIKSKNRATVASSISMILSLTMAITNVIFGYLVEWNIKYALIILGVLAILLTFLSRVQEEHLGD